MKKYGAAVTDAESRKRLKNTFATFTRRTS